MASPAQVPPKPGAKNSMPASRPINEIIGEARLAHYMNESGNDTSGALAFYEWNSIAGASLFKDIGYLEIGLRNSVDSQMVKLWKSRGWAGDWLDDMPKQLGRHDDPKEYKYPYRDIIEARKRAKRRMGAQARAEAAGPSHDQVIAQTSLGMWHALVSSSHKAFWPTLSSAFPYAPNRTQDVVNIPLSKVRSLRNSIAHHQRIYHRRLDVDLDSILDIAGYIDPSLRKWINEHSYTEIILKQRPPKE